MPNPPSVRAKIDGSEAPEVYNPPMEFNGSGAPEVYNPPMEPDGSGAPEVYNLPPILEHEPPTAHEAPEYSEDHQAQFSIVPEAYLSVIESGTDKEAQNLLIPIRSENAICGLKKRIFYIAIGALILIVAVASGIRGVLSSKKYSKSLVSGSGSSDVRTNGQSLSPTVTDNSGVVIVEATGTVARTTTRATATSPSTATPTAGSRLAAVNWDTDFMIFYQDSANNIRMVESNFTLQSASVLNYTWSRATLLPFTARSSSPIAAIGWTTSGHRELRVYTFSDSNAIQEYGWSSQQKKWTGGNINNTITTGSKESQLTAVRNKGSIRLFYQDTSGRLAGLFYPSVTKWSTATEFTNTISTDWPLADSSGSGLSAVNSPTASPSGVRVYYQDTSGDLNWWDGKAVGTSNEDWSSGTQLEQITATTPLSAVAVANETDRYLQLFYIQSNKLVVDLWNAAGSATSTGVNTTTVSYLGSGGLSAEGPSVAALTFSGMVLVVCGASSWFNIWQYTPWDGSWNNLELPIAYFEG